MIAGLAFLIGLAIWFGRKERRRIGHVKANEPTAFTGMAVSQFRRPAARTCAGSTGR